MLFASVTIGQSDYFGFGFTTVKLKNSLNQATVTVFNNNYSIIAIGKAGYKLLT